MFKKPVLISLLLVTLLSTTIIASLRVEVSAQENSTLTPTPQETPKYQEPEKVEGAAVWTLNSSTFLSNYPDGFIFEGNATSSAGSLASVSIFYSHNPGYENDVRMRGEVDAATGDMRVLVSGRDADGIPPWVEVNYRWRVTDTAGTVYWSQWFVGAEYADSTHRWDRYESEDVLIFIQDGFPQAAIDLTFEAMARARPVYEEAFGRLLSYKPRMMLFADLDTFREWRSFEYGAGGTYIVGQASPQWGAFIQVLGDNNIEEFAYGIVVHEIAHLYQHDLYEFRAPNWWIEGNATYFEFEHSYDYERRVRNRARDNQLPRLFIEGGPLANSAGPDGFGRWGYDVGYTFNKWLVENYGWAAHRAIVARLGEAETLASFEVDDYFIETLEAVLGMSIDDIERAWRVWLGAPATAPTLIPTPTFEYRFPPTVTPFRW